VGSEATRRALRRAVGGSAGAAKGSSFRRPVL
jgi:hypothetical protein